MTLNIIPCAIVIVVQIFSVTTAVFQYDVLLRDETIYSPCEIPDVNYISDYLDLSEMNYEFLNNGSLYIHGSQILLKDIGTEDNPLSIELFKKSRDNWVNTIYNIKRPDLCKAIFGSMEPWEKYLKEIPEEDRTCPFVRGKRYNFNDAADLTLSFPDSRFAGEYKIQTIVKLQEINETACANIFVEVYKH